MKDVFWPSDLILDLGKANWLEWSHTLSLSACQCGLCPWLDSSLPCPDPSNSADANYVWLQNDDALSAFILRQVSPADINNTNNCTTAFQIFECLRVLHENQGAYAQISLLMKALELRLSYDTSLHDTVAEARNFYQRIIAMGKIKDDDIFTAILLHMMSRDFIHLQQSVQNMTHLPSFNFEMIIRCILDEDALIRCHKELSQPANPLSPTTISSQSAFLAHAHPRGPKPFCTNCKRENHTADFCISPGGKMAGKTTEEAHAAYRAKNPRPPRPPPTSAHIASSSSIPSTSSVSSPSPATSDLPVIINGRQYIPDPSFSPSLPPPPPSAYITEVADVPDYPYHAFLAYSCSLNAFSAPILPSSLPPSSFNPSNTLPFIIDSGAACHLSPLIFDFKTLHPINSYPINGIGNSVNAVGIEMIEINTSSGKFILHDAFYVPSASVRLISVYLLLNPSSKLRYRALFSSDYVLIIDEANRVLAKGVAFHDCCLFFLSDFTLHVPPSISPPSSTHYASHLPGIDSWHKHLGHCNNNTIIKMAHSLGTKGMPINLSLPASKCESCILGKQTRTAVPKTQEGARATSPLERIYVDLCGPMSKPSRTGRLYLMNFIDDYSSFIWSLPLRNKSEASTVFKHWLMAVELQTPHKLKCLVTDNGELTSLQLCELCAERGILCLFTAPYTSMHNGRAERLHRTLMDKAHSMRFSCSAPVDMWDEFCATAAYLSNLTFTTTNSGHNGKSPYQLWHSRDPPLLHLHEIGCCTYALTLTHNPKLYQRSIPCVLIGYAPNSKAYRLWDPVTDPIFNSFHVSFIETHQLPPPMPTSLLNSNLPPMLPLKTHLQQPSPPVLPHLPLPPPLSNPISYPVSVPPSTQVSTLHRSVPLQINNIPPQNNNNASLLPNNVPIPHTLPSPYNTVVNPKQNNTVSSQINTAPPQNNTVHPQNNTVSSQIYTALPQNNTIHP